MKENCKNMDKYFKRLITSWKITYVMKTRKVEDVSDLSLPTTTDLGFEGNSDVGLKWCPFQIGLGDRWIAVEVEWSGKEEVEVGEGSKLRWVRCGPKYMYKHYTRWGDLSFNNANQAMVGWSDSDIFMCYRGPYHASGKYFHDISPSQRCERNKSSMRNILTRSYT